MVPCSAAFTRKDVPHVPRPGLLRRMALSSPCAVFLESSLRQPRYGERDLLFLDPCLTIVLPRGADQLTVVVPGEAPRVLPGDPLDALERLFTCTDPSSHDDTVLSPPVVVGYISYEAGRFAECMPPPVSEGPNLPDMYFICPTTIIIADMVACTTTIYTRASSTFNIESLTESSMDDHQAECTQRRGSEVRSSLSRHAYIAAVEKTIEYIRRGDIFQANITRQLFIDSTSSPDVVYERLSQVSPAPYSAWIDLGHGNAVLSSSMELFLRVRGRHVITRPIKGTVTRGATPEEDRALQMFLKQNVKERAELTMIIDVERNDLGRVCVPGSVSVPDLYRVETFPHVHHLVATVRGELRHDTGIGALLKATLPGGSITGAPKVRAMEIIGELEPMRRGVYTGAIGWWDAKGNAEFSIAIRTIMREASGRAYFPAGCGIVADSVPEKEYEETLHKAKGMAMALGLRWPDDSEAGFK